MDIPPENSIDRRWEIDAADVLVWSPVFRKDGKPPDGEQIPLWNTKEVRRSLKWDLLGWWQKREWNALDQLIIKTKRERGSIDDPCLKKAADAYAWLHDPLIRHASASDPTATAGVPSGRPCAVIGPYGTEDGMGLFTMPLLAASDHRDDATSPLARGTVGWVYRVGEHSAGATLTGEHASKQWYADTASLQSWLATCDFRIAKLPTLEFALGENLGGESMGLAVLILNLAHWLNLPPPQDVCASGAWMGVKDGRKEFAPIGCLDRKVLAAKRWGYQRLVVVDGQKDGIAEAEQAGLTIIVVPTDPLKAISVLAKVLWNRDLPTPYPQLSHLPFPIAVLEDRSYQALVRGLGFDAAWQVRKLYLVTVATVTALLLAEASARDAEREMHARTIVDELFQHSDPSYEAWCRAYQDAGALLDGADPWSSLGGSLAVLTAASGWINAPAKGRFGTDAELEVITEARQYRNALHVLLNVLVKALTQEGVHLLAQLPGQPSVRWTGTVMTTADDSTHQISCQVAMIRKGAAVAELPLVPLVAVTSTSSTELSSCGPLAGVDRERLGIYFDVVAREHVRRPLISPVRTPNMAAATPQAGMTDYARRDRLERQHALRVQSDYEPEQSRDLLIKAIDACPGGYLLLEAHAGMGKSRLTALLESGHQRLRALGDQPLRPILRVRITPGVVSDLDQVCRELFDTLTKGRGSRTCQFRDRCGQLPSAPPNLNQDPDHNRSAIYQWLEMVVQRIGAGLGKRRLVVIIDGLDEIEDPRGERETVSGLPTRLPDGVVILLTSRPLDQCRPAVMKDVKERLRPVTIHLDPDGYRQDLVGWLTKGKETEKEKETPERAEKLVIESKGNWRFLAHLREVRGKGLDAATHVTLADCYPKYFAVLGQRLGTGLMDEMHGRVLAMLHVAGRPLSLDDLVTFGLGLDLLDYALADLGGMVEANLDPKRGCRCYRLAHPEIGEAIDSPKVPEWKPRQGNARNSMIDWLFRTYGPTFETLVPGLVTVEAAMHAMGHNRLVPESLGIPLLAAFVDQLRSVTEQRGGYIVSQRMTWGRALNTVCQSLVARDPDNSDWHQRLGISHDRIGSVLQEQGNLSAALDEFSTSLSILRQLAKRDPDNTQWQRDLGASHKHVGEILFEQEDEDGIALDEFRTALSIFEQLAKRDPNNTQWQRELAVSHDNVGSFLQLNGDYVGALSEYRKSYSIRVLSAKRDVTTNNDWESDLVHSHNYIGNLLKNRGDLDDALIEFRAAFSISKQVAAQNPTDSDCQHWVAISHNDMSNILQELGRLPDALRESRAAIAICGQLAARYPENNQWKVERAKCHENTGNLLREQGHMDAALLEFLTGLALRKQLASLDPANNRWKHELAVCHGHISVVFIAMGDVDSALSEFLAGLDLRKELVALDPTNSFWQDDHRHCRDLIGKFMERQGRWDDALGLHRQWTLLVERSVSLDHTIIYWWKELPGCHDRIVNYLEKTGKWNDALVESRRQLTFILQLAEQTARNCHWQRSLADSHCRIGTILKTQGDLEAALSEFRQDLIISKQLAALDVTNFIWQYSVINGHERIGDILKIQGKWDDALTEYHRQLSFILQLVKQTDSNRHWQRAIVVTRCCIGDIQKVQGDLETALSEFRQCLVISELLAEQDAATDNGHQQFIISKINRRIGICLIELKDMEFGRAHLLRSLALLNELARGSPSSIEFLRDLAHACYALAAVETSPNHFWQRTMDALTDLKNQQPLDAEEQRILAAAQAAVGLSVQ